MHCNNTVFAFIFYTYHKRKPNFEKCSIYSNKFFHKFHLSESSLTCPELQASGLVQRLHNFHLSESSLTCPRLRASGLGEDCNYLHAICSRFVYFQLSSSHVKYFICYPVYVSLTICFDIYSTRMKDI